ncbi:MAG: tRNA uridine-5-carboxymethylaminomethyl(34) synthesis GTPase MnmE [Alloprevotella sp.]|nr:tRNA uridine-5-carboxymethylaminomethyl(34) synthesis GTPase MnmE [Alloprevotella sp.]
MVNSQSSDTICATATAPGGALGIVRVSGPDALGVSSSLLQPKDVKALQAGAKGHFCRVFDGDALLDEVVLSASIGTHSYTGEDSVEFSCHGSQYILGRLLALLVENGCRMARPGEFTQRAFLNGKLDLTQSEAVADLIAAQSRAAHHAAISQLKGNFRNELQELRDQLLRLTSLLELELDFSDHEDLEFADRSELLELSEKIDRHISRLIMSFKAGQAVKNGIPVAIVGETNVGKSTLLNQLLKEERAIVSDVHGTTRDTIEDTIILQGVTFRFIDTAGIRDTEDSVEQIGIDRTYEAIRRASIVIWLTDQRPSNRQVDEMQALTEGKQLLVVQNKCDLLPSEAESWTCPMSFISARNGIGISELEDRICQAAGIPEISAGETLVTSARHHDALLRARTALARVLSGLKAELSGDLLSEDLRIVLQELGEITGGEITSQETLNNIFRHFCVGK